MFEADGGNGGAGGGSWAWEGGWSGAGAGDSAKADDLAKAHAEVARLGKLVNESAEKEKARQAEEAKKAEDEAKAKGEFEKLATEYKTSLDDITTKHTSASEQLTKYDEHFKTQFESSIKALSKEQKDVIEKLLEWKSNFDKATLLPDLLTQFGGKAFGKDPKGGGSSADASSAYEDSLKKGDKKGAISAFLSSK